MCSSPDAILLARSDASLGVDAAREAFRVIEAIRSQSVQNAITAASARMVPRDPALAGLMRKDQDLEKQQNAMLGLLSSTLALPTDERDDKVVRELGAEVEQLKVARAAARREVQRRYPDYAELIDPKAPSLDDVRAVLRPGEALVSLYFGQFGSFAWALQKEGPVAFALLATTQTQIEAKVRKLREALEPQARTLADIPPFDLALAHDLYLTLLGPTESTWRPATSLIVVTNGALGLLPLGLLPTAAFEIKPHAGPPFSAYRDVPWLARTHAVTVMPSSAALLTLRKLPAASSRRDTLIGFGDPYFSEQQQAEAVRGGAAAPSTTQLAMAATRGAPLALRATARTAGVDSFELARLPRLPDTGDELRAIARALGTDPAKVLHLGKAANERAVKSAELSRYRIVAFSTHGLLPGDLDGLTQPALALSAPKVAEIEGDGLLTMDEILGLKLDADWVLLSACNTGAGTSEGAEAVSGLGRAFFYAGTRALLVTNWSVHSASASDLVSDVFRRLAAEPALPRSEALRQAMVALMDGAGLKSGNGETIFSYAHPMFWAPYSIIGEGGRT